MRETSISVDAASVHDESFVMCNGFEFAAPVNDGDILCFAAIMTKHTYWKAVTGKPMNLQKRNVGLNNVGYMTQLLRITPRYT